MKSNWISWTDFNWKDQTDAEEIKQSNEWTNERTSERKKKELLYLYWMILQWPVSKVYFSQSQMGIAMLCVFSVCVFSVHMMYDVWAINI